MKKFFIGLLIFLSAFFVSTNVSLAQSPTPEQSAEPIEIAPQEVAAPVQDEYSRAVVVDVTDEQPSQDIAGYSQIVQKVKLKIISGSEKDKEIDVEHGSLFAITDDQKVSKGETVVITKTQGPTGELYYITDKYRMDGIFVIFAIFIALVLFFGKVRGVTSLLGLLLSVLVLIKYVVPQILAGRDPVLVSVMGALVIAVLSLYMAHGINRRTTVALFSTIATLFISAVLAIVYVKFSQLTGTGSEEAIFLRMGPLGNIDLKGLLLGGIIIGALGVLDDITISQSTMIDELRQANPSLSKAELYKRGTRLGREHIASLINTLALAYVGASFPLLMLFSVSQDIPFWLTLNSEFIIEEVVRTLVGSSALILAVPISTFMAAYFLGKQTNIVEAEVVAETPKKVTRKPRKASTRKTSRRAKKA